MVPRTIQAQPSFSIVGMQQNLRTNPFSSVKHHEAHVDAVVKAQA